MRKNSVSIQIIFAKKNIQIKLDLIIEEGKTIAYLYKKYRHIICKYLEKQYIQFGVFGYNKSLDYVIKDGDRVEVYRKLILDPIIRRKNLLNKKNM